MPRAGKKLAQFRIKVWFHDGGSWECATDRNLTVPEFAKGLRDYADMLLKIAADAEARGAQ